MGTVNSIGLRWCRLQVVPIPSLLRKSTWNPCSIIVFFFSKKLVLLHDPWEGNARANTHAIRHRLTFGHTVES